MLFFNSAASDFGYCVDMLGNPPRMNHTQLPKGVLNHKVVTVLNCLDLRAKIGKYCRHPGKQL